MANSKRRKSPQSRLAGYKAEFRKTSKRGCRYARGVRPRYAKFFTFDQRGKVINRLGFTNAKILASIGGEPTYKRISATHQAAANQNIERQLDRDAEKADSEGNFDPKNTKDGRDKTVRAINLRRGQLVFRKQVLEAYGGRCAVTNCDCPDALEAAHISAYRGDHTNHIQNGILLRSDIHTLFDIGRIGFSPDSHRVIVSASLEGTVYARLKGNKLRLPSQPENRPSEQVLRRHLERFRLKIATERVKCQRSGGPQTSWSRAFLQKAKIPV